MHKSAKIICIFICKKGGGGSRAEYIYDHVYMYEIYIYIYDHVEGILIACFILPIGVIAKEIV